MDLKDKSCLITGGTKGIGAATAIAMAQHGADVAIVGRNADAEAKETIRQVESLGRRCVMVQADVGRPEDVAMCVAETVKLGSDQTRSARMRPQEAQTGLSDQT